MQNLQQPSSQQQRLRCASAVAPQPLSNSAVAVHQQRRNFMRLGDLRHALETVQRHRSLFTSRSLFFFLFIGDSCASRRNSATDSMRLSIAIW